jgi:hypothetical protein
VEFGARAFLRRTSPNLTMGQRFTRPRMKPNAAAITIEMKGALPDISGDHVIAVVLTSTLCSDRRPVHRIGEGLGDGNAHHLVHFLAEVPDLGRGGVGRRVVHYHWHGMSFWGQEAYLNSGKAFSESLVAPGRTIFLSTIWIEL